MPRDIPVGNGQMLVTFDQHYQIRDIYYPHVGQENHTGGSPCRFGVWSPLQALATAVAGVVMVMIFRDWLAIRLEE